MYAAEDSRIYTRFAARDGSTALNLLQRRVLRGVTEDATAIHDSIPWNSHNLAIDNSSRSGSKGTSASCAAKSSGTACKLSLGTEIEAVECGRCIRKEPAMSTLYQAL